MSSNDEPPHSPSSSRPLPGHSSSSPTQEASSSRPRPPSSGQTYAQIAASATRPPSTPDNWSMEDIDRADHLDSLSSYEGILQGHNWPIAPLPRPRRVEPTGTDSAQTISLDEILDNQLRTDINSSSNIDVPSNPPLLPPPSRTARLSTERWPSDPIAGDVRRIFGDSAQTGMIGSAAGGRPFNRSTSLRDRMDQFESVLREGRAASRGDTIIPAPPTDQPVRRRRNPRILSRPLDSDEPHPYFFNMDIDPSLSSEPNREEAPWRTVHIHPNTDLQVGTADIEDDEEEEGYDDYTDMFPSQLAGEVAQLRRGGNNRPRNRQRAETDSRARETLLDQIRYGMPGDRRSTRRAVTLYRPSRGGMTPTNGESGVAETVRSSLDRGIRSRSPSFSPSHPAKRRRVTPNPGPVQALVRPSYLKYTTLPDSTPLPGAFQPPERHSHLALTTHRPNPSSADPTTSTALPASPSRPLISFTVHPPPSSTDADACSLRTLLPVPPGLGVYYFEAEVIDSGKEGYMSIGYMKAGVNMGRLVGWEKGSWGWHADDGRAFEGSGVGKEFGPGWGVGDIVGAGVDYTTGRGFFTKNGKLIGHIFTNLPQGLHPAIGLRNPLESIAVNLTGPFLYDIDQHVMKVRDGMLKGLKDRIVAQIPRITPLGSTVEKGSNSEKPSNQIVEVASKSSIALSVDAPAFTGKRKEEQLDHIVNVQEKSAPTTSPETAFTDPIDKTVTALVLDHLSHSGLEKVKSLVIRDLARRKLMPEPLSALSPGSAAQKPLVRIISVCDTVSKGGRVPWGQIAELARSSGDEREKGKEDEVAEVDEGLRRKLRILDLVGMLLSPSPPANQPIRASDNTAEDTTMSEGTPKASANHQVKPEPANADLSDSAISEGKRLLAASTSESWTLEEKRWLSEAFGLISGSADEAVWEGRREAWSKELKESLKIKQGLKASLYLQQAYTQTGRVMDLLIGKGDGGAAFVDPIAFVREHGKPVRSEKVKAVPAE